MTPQEKLIAEVRAAVAGVPVNPEDGSTSDVNDMAEAFECIKDALIAYDQEIADDKPEWPQE